MASPLSHNEMIIKLRYDYIPNALYANAIHAQVSLIKVEISQQKKEKDAILNTPKDDVHLRYHRLLMLPPTPTLTIGAIHTLVCQKLLELDKAVNCKQGFFGQSAPYATKRMIQAETKQLELELANSETSLMEIVEAANSDIREFDRLLNAINGIFKKLAASLPFSLDIVGIVARYGI